MCVVPIVGVVTWISVGCWIWVSTFVGFSRLIGGGQGDWRVALFGADLVCLSVAFGLGGCGLCVYGSVWCEGVFRGMVARW